MHITKILIAYLGIAFLFSGHLQSMKSKESTEYTGWQGTATLPVPEKETGEYVGSVGSLQPAHTAIARWIAVIDDDAKDIFQKQAALWDWLTASIDNPAHFYDPTTFYQNLEKVKHDYARELFDDELTEDEEKYLRDELALLLGFSPQLNPLLHTMLSSGERFYHAWVDAISENQRDAVLLDLANVITQQFQDPQKLTDWEAKEELLNLLGAMRLLSDLISASVWKQIMEMILPIYERIMAASSPAIAIGTKL